MRLPLLCAPLLLLSLAACQKADDAKPSTGDAKTAQAKPAQGKPAPADAKSIAEFRAANDAQSLTGKVVKIHGYVGSVNGKAWPLVGKVGDTLPFVFCDMASPPAGVAKGAHVVAEGKVEDQSMLKSCTITPL